MMIKSNTFLDSIFEWIFFVLASENESKMSYFRTFIENTHFAKGRCFSKGKIAVFLLRSFQRSTEIRYSNALTNNVEKKAWKIELESPFGPPKSLKIGPKSDVKRSLLRDAMEIMRNSSETNETHSL